MTSSLCLSINRIAFVQEPRSETRALPDKSGRLWASGSKGQLLYVMSGGKETQTAQDIVGAQLNAGPSWPSETCLQILLLNQKCASPGSLSNALHHPIFVCLRSLWIISSGNPCLSFVFCLFRGVGWTVRLHCRPFLSAETPASFHQLHCNCITQPFNMFLCFLPQEQLYQELKEY